MPDLTPPDTTADADGAQDREAGAGGPGTRWFYYCLGLSLQTLLWFLLFLAIVVAVLVGNRLTEFRYVGF
jgi:hypothetical protein